MRSNSIAVIGLLAILAVGCNKRVPIAPLPPPAVPSTPVATPPVTNTAVATAPPANPGPTPAALALDQANRAFLNGNFDDASRGYESFLRLTSTGDDQRDFALFQLGLTFVLRPATAADWPKAAATFKQLQDEYPASPLKASANLVMSLHAEVDQAAADLKQRDLRIKQLTTELDRLKKIDADRRKRP
jgi:hypothetical protein